MMTELKKEADELSLGVGKSEFLNWLVVLYSSPQPPNLYATGPTPYFCCCCFLFSPPVGWRVYSPLMRPSVRLSVRHN
jgi:hypothetical protein